MKTLIFLLGFTVGIILVWKYKTWRKKKEQQENLYNMKYLWIEDAIEHWPVTMKNYKGLRLHVKKLGQMEFKNKEKTQALNCKLLLGRFNPEAVKDCMERNNIKI